MVVPGGGARLVVLLVLSVLAPDPPPWGARAASPAADDDIRELQQAELRGQQEQQHAARPAAARGYLPQELQNDGQEMPVDEDATHGEEVAYDQAAVEKSVTDVQVGCRELRAKRFISDGFCTSIKPIREVVCAGNCLPIMDLPWYAEFVKVWARSKVREWQCEEDMVQRQSVHLLCRNGQYRTYRIKVVKSCKCKKTHPNHNRTDRPGAKKPRRDDDGDGDGATSSSSSKKKKERRRDKKRKTGRSSRQSIAAADAAANLDSGSVGGQGILRNVTDKSRGRRRKDPVTRPPPARTVAGDWRASDGEGRDSFGGPDRISDAARSRRDAQEDDVALDSWR